MPSSPRKSPKKTSRRRAGIHYDPLTRTTSMAHAALPAYAKRASGRRAGMYYDPITLKTSMAHAALPAHAKRDFERYVPDMEERLRAIHRRVAQPASPPRSPSAFVKEMERRLRSLRRSPPRGSRRRRRR